MPNMGCMVGTAYQAMVAGMAKRLRAAGMKLTVPEYMVLRALYSEEGIQQCELAAILGKDQSAICRGVIMMEKKGLLRTEQISHKCRKVFLTSESEALRPKIMAVAEEAHTDLLSILGPEESEALLSALTKIIRNNNQSI